SMGGNFLNLGRAAAGRVTMAENFGNLLPLPPGSGATGKVGSIATRAPPREPATGKVAFRAAPASPGRPPGGRTKKKETPQGPLFTSQSNYESSESWIVVAAVFLLELLID